MDLNNTFIKLCLGLALLFTVLTLNGCDLLGPKKPAEEPICVGSKNITQALAAIDANRNIRPVQGLGRCTVTYYDSKDEKHTEVSDVRLRFVPPYNMLFTGSTVFGEAFRVGLNDNEFWFMLKLESEYYYGGRVHSMQCKGSHLVNPAMLMEALGIISVDSSYKFEKVRGEDVLSKISEDGKAVKRIFINRCSSRIVRVEYFDKAGLPLITTSLDEYVTTDGLTVPSKIDIINHDTDGISLEIDLRGLKMFKPTQKQLDRLFVMPSKDGYDYIYELNQDCKFVRR